MIRAVFFDLDNTLVASSPAWRNGLDAAITMLLERRPNLSRALVREAWRQTSHVLEDQLEVGTLTVAQVRDLRWRETLSALGIADNALAVALEAKLSLTFLDGLRLFTDVDVIERLRDRYHVGIITNGADDNGLDSQRTKAVHLGLLARVDSFLASDAVGCRKPNRCIFMLALEHAQVLPSEAVYVGDSVTYDVVGANRAGMRSVLLWRTGESLPELAGDECPGYVITSLWNLGEIIKTDSVKQT